MKLPNGDRADIGEKLKEYVLNFSHRDGRHKARVFERVLGIDLENNEILSEAILHAAKTADDVQSKGDNGHGEMFVLRFALATAKGTAMVLTGWIIRRGEDFPRLTTCYIL